MKKLYSFLALVVMALCSFSAAATADAVYTFECNQDALTFIKGNPTGMENGRYTYAEAYDAPYADGAYTITGVEENSSVFVNVAEGYKLTEITANGEAIRFNEDAPYNFSFSTWQYPESTTVNVVVASEAAVVDFTFTCNEDALLFGDGAPVNMENGRYVFNSYLDVPYIDGAYTISSKDVENAIYYNIAEGYTATAIKVNGEDWRVANCGSFALLQFPEGATIDVTVEESVVYTFNCPAGDVLNFVQAGTSLYPAYNGYAYTLDANGSLDAIMVSAKEGYSIVYAATVEGTEIRVENGQFSFSPYTYPESTTVNVTAVEVYSYTVNCDEDVLEFVKQTGAEEYTPVDYTYAEGAYTITGVNGVIIARVQEGKNYDIVSVAVEGGEAPSIYNNEFTINTTQYASGTVITVEVAERVVVYTVNCSSPVLTFTQNGTELEANYEDGAYTVIGDGSYDQIMATLVEGARFKIAAVTANENDVYVNENTAFTFSPYNYTTNTTFDVALIQLYSYTVNCAQDVLEFVIRTGAEEYTQVESTYADGAYTLSDIEIAEAQVSRGVIITARLVEDAAFSIKSVSIEGYSEPRVEENASFEINTTQYLDGTVFNVALQSDVVYTFNCESDVLSFSQDGNALAADYVDGAYILTGFAVNGPSVNVTVAEGVNAAVVSVVDEEGNEIRVSEDYNAFAINTYTYAESATFNVTLADLYVYTVACSADVLDFGYANGIEDGIYTYDAINASYDETLGEYAVPVIAGKMLVVTLKDADNYEFETVSVNDVERTVEGTQFEVNTTEYPYDITIVVTLNDNTDGIRGIFADENGNLEIYNLNGVKVNSNNVAPGIYIVNGAKVLVK